MNLEALGESRGVDSPWQ